MKLSKVINSNTGEVEFEGNYKECCEYKEAAEYNNLTDYFKVVTSNVSTLRQRGAVRFCEKWLDVEFIGDITDFDEVSAFLGEYLEEAKLREEELYNDYQSYLWEKY